MFTTFEQSKGLAKTKHVRCDYKGRNGGIYQSDALDKIKEQFDDNLKTCPFIGGSAGAKVFNDFISNTPQLTEKYNVINISGTLH
mgnify:CR=1 FL=1